MLDMTDAPIPMAIPAMAPGLIRWPFLCSSEDGAVNAGGVSSNGVEVVFPKGTFITEASDDAYSTGKLVKSLVCQNNHTGCANAVPERISTGGFRIVVMLTKELAEHNDVARSRATTVWFPELQDLPPSQSQRLTSLKIVVKDV